MLERILVLRLSQWHKWRLGGAKDGCEGFKFGSIWNVENSAKQEMKLPEKDINYDEDKLRLA